MIWISNCQTGFTVVEQRSGKLSPDWSPAQVGCVWTRGWRWDLLPSGLELSNKPWVSGIGFRCHAPTNTDFSWIHRETQHVFKLTLNAEIYRWNDASSCDLHGTALYFFLGKLWCAPTNTDWSEHASETLMKMKDLKICFVHQKYTNKQTHVHQRSLIILARFLDSLSTCSVMKTVKVYSLVNSCSFYSDI